MARQYECLEAGCGAVIVATDQDALIKAVHEHMADEHDSFELEEVIVDASTAVEGEEG
jgi:predicted small metal-binding protein